MPPNGLMQFLNALFNQMGGARQQASQQGGSQVNIPMFGQGQVPPVGPGTVPTNPLAGLQTGQSVLGQGLRNGFYMPGQGKNIDPRFSMKAPNAKKDPGFYITPQQLQEILQNLHPVDQ